MHKLRTRKSSQGLVHILGSNELPVPAESLVMKAVTNTIGLSCYIYSQWGQALQYVGPLLRVCRDTWRRRKTRLCSEKKKAWAGWQPCGEVGARIAFKNVVQPKEEVQKENLETIQKKSLDAVKEIEHTTKLERHTDATKSVRSKVVAR